MNILLINHYAGSDRHGMEYRPYYMAREWTRTGHHVTIVAASYAHLRTSQPAVESSLETETIDGIDYRWVRTPSYQCNGWRRALNIFVFVLRLLRSAGRLARDLRPDAVIASSTYPLDMVPARAIARRSGALLVFE